MTPAPYVAYLDLKTAARTDIGNDPDAPRRAENLARGHCPACSHTWPYLTWAGPDLAECHKCGTIHILPTLYQLTHQENNMYIQDPLPQDPTDQRNNQADTPVNDTPTPPNAQTCNQAQQNVLT